ncbi:F-box protein At5g07670-like isoform X2 [Cynara cardunculus var. scolymus]|uniref:F-box protein At5g07670-like isoform X2 n=1 Tax=Cynara cardunculus var. scolymus TaxID=59895 RepID=UPI000D630C6A|nr:F-box protein At5g07670-like isoform X2 [Cynara cardunculus var. scolymus]
MRFKSLSDSNTPPSEPDESPTLDKGSPISVTPDFTSLLSDQILILILSNLTKAQQISSCLVCKRWSRISGGLVKSLRLLDWDFLDSGRLAHRFPNLLDVDIVQACIISPRNSGICLSNKFVSIHVNSFISDTGFIWKPHFLGAGLIDRGVQILAQGCPNLRRLVLLGASKEGLASVANECLALQELELCSCTDMDLKGLSGFRNLQILKLIGSVDGLYDLVISDIGLTILAQGCPRLLKLELVGCEGSYDGIKAIGQCCQMMEELTLCDHRMEGGWLAALSYCTNLKTLKFQSCKFIDQSPGPDEHLGSCPTLEELHLQRCQLRDKQGLGALFLVCEAVRELVFEDCWGLHNNTFSAASICRRVTSLSLEGCSLLTMDGFDPVVLSWKELKRLKVVSCNNIKDSAMTPELATLFSVLKELKWRPDSKSILSSGLDGSGIWQKGSEFKCILLYAPTNR